MGLNLKNSVAIISGSSQGIGFALAKELGLKGCTLIINGRNPEKLSRAKNKLSSYCTNLHAVCQDISKKEGAEKLVAETVAVFGKIDFVINNAGFSMGGAFADLNLGKVEEVIDINLLGSIYLTKFALPHVRLTKGSIVFVSSLAGIRGLPYYAPYSISKMSLKALADCLRIEERQHSVHIGLINVGFTENDPQKTTYNSKGKEVLLNERKGMKKQTQQFVAGEIIKMIRRRTSIKTLSRIGKLLMFMEKAAPNILDIILLKNQHKIKKFF